MFALTFAILEKNRGERQRNRHLHSDEKRQMETLKRAETSEDFQALCHEYAHNALKTKDEKVREALVRRQIPLQKVRGLETSYQIAIKLGGNISFSPLRNLISQQIDAAADFLGDFQIGILGQPTSLFQLYEIEFLIERDFKLTFDFCVGKLLVQLPYWKIKWLKQFLKSSELRQRWDRGEHLSRFSPSRRVWWLLNPIGEFRSHLKSTLILAIQKSILGIDKLFSQFALVEEKDRLVSEPEPTPPVPTSFRQAALAYLKSVVNENKLGFSLESGLKTEEESTLWQLLKQFKENLTEPQQIEEIIDVAALTLQETLAQEQSQVAPKMFGLVNVGNYHRIDVELNLSTGYLKKYVEVIPRQAEFKAVQFGVVNVYTVDDITVKPNFHRALKLDFETAALEKALQQLALGEWRNKKTIKP